MRLSLFLCSAMLVTSSFSVAQEVAIPPKVFIDYEVLEVFPRGRTVVIKCYSSQMPPPITYTLLRSPDIEVDKQNVSTRDEASFRRNITLESRPDLLTYSCRASSTLGTNSNSKNLQMYQELWGNPVSQLQANFTLLDRGSDPRIEISCQASGSPPITYSLLRKDQLIYMKQRPNYGQPANFSFPLNQTSNWLQCQAENDINVQSSPLRLVPPGQLPQEPALVLTGSLAIIAAISSWMLVRTQWSRRD
ncbi:protein IL-40 isoform X1 [Diceros bicornis minor]|uniref:protein IL-40 isoform X1 n=1 Tax=Diceros bicornis minor TaxID=77932 RepID=UPI0026EDB88D|nr:protein IL-40 isoform X1 [Diceros bicornis minor]